MANPLSPGDRAPDFTLPADGGGKASLSERKGGIVIIYFYPKDNTSGCTAEALAFSALGPDFDTVGATVIGISSDSTASHDRFKAKHGLNLRLAADEDHKVAEAYGVWRQKSMYGRKFMGIERSTFLVDAKGNISRVWRKVKVNGHAEEVLDAARALAKRP